MYGHKNIVSYLIDKNVNLNAKIEDLTPLMFGIINSKWSIHHFY